MDSRTARRGLPALSASYRRLVCVSLLLPTLARITLGQVPPAAVKDCQPCILRPSPNLVPHYFTFEVKTTQDGRTVEAILVAKEKQAEPFQRLAVKNMTPITEGESFFFGGVDLNQDDFLDLMLVTDRGIANAYADYWLFEPKSGKYAYLGKYPVFRVDAHSHQLFTYERGGEAGLIFESRAYAFRDGNLLLLKSEKQNATAEPGVFRKVTRERINGVMKIVRTEKVKAP
jgi:hypothetical protein